MPKFILWMTFNVLALWLAVILVPGIRSPQSVDILWMGLVLGFLNQWIAPVLRFLTFPIRWLTLGVFSVVINIFLFYLAWKIGRLFGLSLEISSLWAIVEGALIVSLILSILRHVTERG